MNMLKMWKKVSICCEKYGENSQLYLTYLLLLFLCLPIFVSLDFSTGIHFDAFVKRSYSLPSVPVSIFVFIILCLFKCKIVYLAIRKNIMLVATLCIYMVLDLYWGINRGVIVGVGALLLLFSYYIFRDIFDGSKALHILFNVLCIVILVKFICDIWLQFYHIYTGNQFFYYAQTIQDNYFSTIFFIADNMAIYTYYSYFPFIYYLVVLLSVDLISKKEEYLRPLLMIVISYLVIINTGSRLFEYGLYLIPLIFFMTHFLKLSKQGWFIFLCVIGLIVISALSVVMWGINDVSLAARNHHLYNFFAEQNMINYLFPFLNEYRQVYHRSLHNEFIEMFSLFSFGAMLFYYFLYKIYMNTDERYEFVVHQLAFILVIGSLIQLNLTNSYLSIIIGMTFAVFYGEVIPNRVISVCLKER